MSSATYIPCFLKITIQLIYLIGVFVSYLLMHSGFFRAGRMMYKAQDIDKNLLNLLLGNQACYLIYYI